jgi:hypothetical protein
MALSQLWNDGLEEAHKNLAYPNRGFSKYFMATNGISTTTLRMSSLYRGEACFTVQGAFSLHNGRLCSRDNPHSIRERGYQDRFSVSIWDGVVEDIDVGPCQLPDRQSDQRHHDFHETVLPGLLEDIPQAVRQSLWLQHNRFPVHYGEIYGSG